MSSIQYLMIDSLGQGESLLEHLQTSPPRALAIDTKVRFGRSVDLGSGHIWNDVRSIEPLCLGLAWREALVTRVVVIDLRVEGMDTILVRLCAQPIHFIFHDLRRDLFAFWALGVDPTLKSVFDTRAAAAAISLGDDHVRGAGDRPAARRNRERRLSLVGQCDIYELNYPHSMSKDDLMSEFGDLRPGNPLSTNHVRLCGDDALYTLRLFGEQRAAVVQAGAGPHLEEVEFPAIRGFARMQWMGFATSQDRVGKLRRACELGLSHRAELLDADKVHRPNEEGRVVADLSVLGLDGLVVRGGHVDERALERHAHAHPVLAHYLAYRWLDRTRREPWLTHDLVGIDDRVHPSIEVLGQATGRVTIRMPAVSSLKRAFRPVVDAPHGRAIFECDYTAIDVAVAAGLFQDEALIAAYNSGDVYSVVAKDLFLDSLTTQEKGLCSSEFKARCRTYREKAKKILLAIFYGMTPETLASHLGTSTTDAERTIVRVLEMFPDVRDGLAEAERLGTERGCAEMVSGLRRHVSDSSPRVYRNTPIQGNGAVVLKKAVADLDNKFRGTSNAILFTVHDAIVVECAVERLTTVIREVVDSMQAAFASYFPRLKVRVEVNSADPSCWNKDGQGDSLDRYLDDPSFRIE